MADLNHSYGLSRSEPLEGRPPSGIATMFGDVGDDVADRLQLDELLELDGDIVFVVECREQLDGVHRVPGNVAQRCACGDAARAEGECLANRGHHVIAHAASPGPSSLAK